MSDPDSSGRNILVFADGTANEGGLLPDENRTNVYKLFRATRTTPETCIDPDRQIAFYISGIGTPPAGARPSLRATLHEGLDQMVGGGLAGKIIEGYVAIISAWRPGDKIYLFGFSRGAYTVRCLAHVLELMGVPAKQPEGKSISFNPKDLFPIAEEAVSILYRHGQTTTDDAARDAKAAIFRERHGSYYTPEGMTSPYFMGVWETVAAEGWDRFLPGHDEVHMPKGVMYVRHAMAIDEHRSDFKRVKWGSERTIRPAVPGEPQPFEQVWFAGCHADIGGGYPENESRLSDITMKWMTDFISKDLPAERRIDIDPRYMSLHPSAAGMMHDECMSGKVPWNRTLRQVDVEGDLHPTVLERLAMAEVRNFVTYGPYRPASLENHPKAKQFFVGASAAT